MSSVAVQKKSASIEAADSEKTVYRVLFLISLCHLFNDAVQAVVPAMFPILEKEMSLSFSQIGMIAFALNIVSSVMQPIIGLAADKKPMPFALPLGLTFSFFGIIGIAFLPTYIGVVISVLLIGLGSAVFHPEGSRVAYMAAGKRRGLAQSIYQVGGNTGQALTPIITAFILVPLGQKGASLFSIVAIAAIICLWFVSKWYAQHLRMQQVFNKKKSKGTKVPLRKGIVGILIVIILLIFARTWYLSAIGNFYTFYAIHEYGFSIRNSQIFLFAFMGMGAVGTFFGGPFADRYGKRTIILLSMIATIPLALLLPHVGPVLAFVLLTVIGFIMMTSFSVTVVYAQELVPGKVGTMSGLTVGLAFGLGAVGAVSLGGLADLVGITNMMTGISFLPILGLLSLLLPKNV